MARRKAAAFTRRNSAAADDLRSLACAKVLDVVQVWNDARVRVSWEFPRGEPDAEMLALSMQSLSNELKVQAALVRAAKLNGDVSPAETAIMPQGVKWIVSTELDKAEFDEVATLKDHWQQPLMDVLRVLVRIGLDVATSQAVCRKCGCTDNHPCETERGPCSWAGEDLCSECSAANSF